VTLSAAYPPELSGTMSEALSILWREIHRHADTCYASESRETIGFFIPSI